MSYLKQCFYNLSNSLMQLVEKDKTQNHLQTFNSMEKGRKYIKMLTTLSWEWLILPLLFDNAFSQ